MRIIINHIEMDDMRQIQGLLLELPKQDTDECIYAFRGYGEYYVKKTKSGFSIFKQPKQEAQG